MTLRRFPRRVIDSEGRRRCPRCGCGHLLPGRIRRVAGRTTREMLCRACGRVVLRRDVSGREGQL